MKNNNAMIRARKAWLKKQKLTIRKMVKAINEHAAHNGGGSALAWATAYSWHRLGSTPRDIYLDRVVAVFPEWPR